MLRTTLVFLSVLLLAACAQNSARLKPLHQGPDLPKGITTSPNGVDGLTVGHRLMASREYEMALKQYLRAAGEEGLTPDVLAGLGTANLKLSRLGQAERMLRMATEKDGEYAAAWNNLGVVLTERGEIGEAARCFEIAFSLDGGKSPEIEQNMKGALAKLKKRAYTREDTSEYEIVREGTGTYRLLNTQ